MQALYLLTGHLVGDFIVQNDFMAAGKTKSHAVCLLHVISYTGVMALFTLTFLPWWAYLLIAATHYPVDRWRLARKFMTIMNCEKFATGDYASWSVILTDFIIHLMTLCGIVAVASPFGETILETFIMAMVLLGLLFVGDIVLRVLIYRAKTREQDVQRINVIDPDALGSINFIPAGITLEKNFGRARTVYTNNAIIIDVPPPAKQPRIAVPVLTGDTLTMVMERLVAIMGHLEIDNDEAQAAMIYALRLRYAYWQERGDSELDYLMQGLPVLINDK